MTPGSAAEPIAPGIRQVDTLLGGWERVTAGFLVEGTQPAHKTLFDALLPVAPPRPHH